MQYDVDKYAKVLELNKILQLLANEIPLSDARNNALCITPCFNLDDAQYQLDCTYAAYTFMGKFAAPTFSGAENIIPLIKRADVGGMLSIAELLSVAKTLKVIRTVKQWRSDIAGEYNTCIDGYFEVLTPNKYLEEKIFAAIKSENELNDNASSELFSLRRKINSAALSVRDKLEKLVHSGEKSKYLQDAIITQRDGRFVVPVKAEHRAQIPGIVHDTSGTGSTVFIEPMAVVEVNNELRVLETKEREEVHRILCELSADAAQILQSAEVSFNALSQLCIIFGKASLAYKQKATAPKLNAQGRIDLKNARHPLIEAKKVVPISITLGKNYNTLVITGPNTGGKTVTLKTIGLLTLMAMCGLMIPADDDSEVAVFNTILADIGDEQSIEQSLSTFSAHMVNIISILNMANENSLVLFDELCAGTDPVEGAALAKAVLVELGGRGAKIAATTHYAELKAYALDSENVENASCEFSVATLQPTYKLLIGVPGRSNAFAISKKLGLGGAIIDNANNYISDDNRRFEEVVRALEQARQSLELERKRVTRLKHELQDEKQRADNTLADIEVQRTKVLDQVKQQAENILDKARYRANDMLSELEEIKKGFAADTAAQMLSRAKSSVNRTIGDIENLADPVTQRINDNYILPRKLKLNDNVLIFDLGRQAVVLQLDQVKNKAYVAAGNMNIWVDIDNLRLTSAENAADKIKKSKISVGKVMRAVSSEFDMRGMTVDEGILELDRYIDNAVMSGVTSITVIHGKGTGALRKAVHSHLKGHKNIVSYRLGTFGEGEAGVTIAELKK